jgi:hypothetical protein
MQQQRSRTCHPPLPAAGASTGSGLAPALLALAVLVIGTPPAALAHHVVRGEHGEHDHFHAHAFSDVKPHQHEYTHTHWHTHVLEDGTVVHHSHPHRHTYWHYGPDETEEEKVTRVPEDRQKAPPTGEGEGRGSDTRFQEGGHPESPGE